MQMHAELPFVVLMLELGADLCMRMGIVWYCAI